MPAESGTTEQWQVGAEPRLLNIIEDADSLLGGLTLHDASERLRVGLENLRALALALENPPPPGALRGALSDAARKPRWFLALDQEEPNRMSMRTRFGRAADAPKKVSDMISVAAAKPLSHLLGPLQLDALTAIDDADYVPNLKSQLNLPAQIKDAL
ncbi:MAG: hypothetical protein ABL931_21355 [Usitatibacteraceae bacterium]